MNKEILEAHIERKNKRFYGYIGKAVKYHYEPHYSVYGGLPKDYDAMIVDVHDEDTGLVDLCLSPKEEGVEATMESYGDPKELRHRMIINNADRYMFVKSIQHKEFANPVESYWE